MKKTLMIVLALVLVAGMAYGMTEKEKPAQGEAPVFTLRADYTETEPNDDCSMANGPFVLGDSYAGSITAGESDWYQYTAGAGNCVLFELAVPVGGVSMDTKMYLWAADCVTELAYNDDFNGFYSGFEFGPTDPGIYYIEVLGFSSSSAGDYVLTTSIVDCPPPPPPTILGADTCNDGVCLDPVDGEFAFSGTTAGATNDYDPITGASSCTSYKEEGPDVVYEFGLSDGATFTADVYYTTSGFDGAVYIVTDCADMDSCVDGSDSFSAPDQVAVTHSGPDAVYYLIIDGYNSDDEGEYEVVYTHNGLFCDAPVAVEDTNWGSLKGMYR